MERHKIVSHKKSSYYRIIVYHVKPGNLFACSFSRSCSSALSSMTDETSSDVYGPLLECLCSWGKASDIIELINERILTTLEDNQAQVSKVKISIIHFAC